MPRPRKTQFGLAYFCARSSPVFPYGILHVSKSAFVQARLTRLERRHGRAQNLLQVGRRQNCCSAFIRFRYPLSKRSGGKFAVLFIELRRKFSQRCYVVSRHQIVRPHHKNEVLHRARFFHSRQSLRIHDSPRGLSFFAELRSPLLQERLQTRLPNLRHNQELWLFSRKRAAKSHLVADVFFELRKSLEACFNFWTRGRHFAAPPPFPQRFTLSQFLSKNLQNLAAGLAVI